MDCECHLGGDQPYATQWRNEEGPKRVNCPSALGKAARHGWRVCAAAAASAQDEQHIARARVRAQEERVRNVADLFDRTDAG